MLSPENICNMKEGGTFFLGNWAKLFESTVTERNQETTSVSQARQQLTSQHLAEEIKALAYLVLKLKNINYTQFESLRGILNLKPATYEVEVNETLAEGFKDCEELRNLLEKMLSLDSKNCLSLKRC